MNGNQPQVKQAQILRDGSLGVAAGASPGPLRARLVSGSVIMLISSGLVGAINLVYNIMIARMLGAAEFGHAAAVYTMLMLMSSVTLAFQLVCSKFVAKNSGLPAKAAVYAGLHRRGWGIGILVGLLLASASGQASHYLNLPTPLYIVLLGIGTTLYVPLGVRRGLMQGMYDFQRLAVNFVVEVVVKLAGAIILLHAGMGVTGVIAAVDISLAIAYLLAQPERALRRPGAVGLPASFREGMQAIVFFVGQVIINNVDIVLVKHFFASKEAGLYAAVSLVGRVVYMLSWSVVSSMFPISAGARSDEGESRGVLRTTVALVLMITSLFILALWIAPASLWRMVLGSGFMMGGQNSYSSLLVLYAVATGIYSLSVVLMTYEMSRKIANAGWVQLAFSGAVVLGISLFHSNLQQVIVVQIVLMTLLLMTVAIPLSKMALFVIPETLPEPVKMRKLRRLREQEVISEFLKAEFYEKEYEPYRERLHRIVYQPDLSNQHEAELRRALLYRRRGRLWQELPADTEWWEVELDAEDISRIRIFPRSQWRRIARGSYYLMDVAERLRAETEAGNGSHFMNKIRSVRAKLQAGTTSSILLIGVDELSPLTIIEGNHRMAAAMLISPETAHQRFRIICGFSPNMTDCCWYQTDLSTLWRYGKNVLRDMRNDHDGIIARMLERTPG